MITAKNHKISVIIAAAGRGERAGLGRNKLLAPLHGAPALWHTLEKFDMPETDEVIIASSECDFKEISALAAPFGFKVVKGGATRTESVKRALAAVTGDIVLIHDGARPYVSRELIKKCIDSVKRFGSAVCALHCTDTIATANYGLVTGYQERNSLYRIQTPQGFFTDDIRRAYELAGDREFTDDSSVYCEFCAFPHVVEGEESNRKLTFASDFLKEAAVLPVNDLAARRIGFGIDVHCFGEGNSVVLGGVKIDCDRSLIAHSDGDVVFHAVTDAILSAAGLKDIGHYFPDFSPEYENADSAHMCAEALKEVLKAGYAPLNISVSVQAEKPRLSPYIDSMVKNIARALNIDEERVAVAAGTCEKLGFVGRGLGITAYACALLGDKKDG